MIFEDLDVKTELVDRLQKHYRTMGIKIRVLKADPRELAEIPCIGINRVGDDESNTMLGGIGGTFQNKTTGVWYRQKSTYFNQSLEIRIWHKNPDERDKIYRYLKAFLFNMRDELEALGLRNITMSGGRDEQENNFPPFPLYWSVINLRYLQPLDINSVANVITDVNVNEDVPEEVNINDVDPEETEVGD